MSEGEPLENCTDLRYQHKCETQEMLEKKCKLLILVMLKDIIFKDMQSSKIKSSFFIKAEHHKYIVGLWMKSCIN